MVVEDLLMLLVVEGVAALAGSLGAAAAGTRSQLSPPAAQGAGSDLSRASPSA